MVQLIQSTPNGEEPALHFDPQSSAEQFRLPYPEEFDEADVPEVVDRGRIIVFVDGANLFYAASQMGIEVDYAKLLRYFRNESQLIYAFFYTGVDPTNMRQQAFLSWMRRNGYRVVTKDVLLQSTGNKRASNMHVEIAVDMVRFAGDCDTEILISGDGDLAYAANAVNYTGLRVEVIALRSMAHDSLIQAADHYIDLLSLRDKIQKLPRQS